MLRKANFLLPVTAMFGTPASTDSQSGKAAMDLSGGDDASGVGQAVFTDISIPPSKIHFLAKVLILKRRV
ncbi:MAG: hypothetical protein WBE56_16585 [Terracidiphilus sp.]